MSSEYKAYRAGINDKDLVTTPYEKDILRDSDTGLVEYDGNNESHYVGSRKYKSFVDAEKAGSIITYRCPDCRGCQNCKNSEEIEEASVEEEIEQELIVKSVTRNPTTQRIEAVLPWIENPLHKLAPNRNSALKFYYKVIKKLNKCEKDKNDIIAAEGKLQKLGYVDYVHNLTPQQQQMLSESVFQNFITWFAVWNSNSVTTSCRPVFNASMKIPETGYSMNDLLAKGKNGMNKLVEIAIRWTMHPIGIHSDVKQLYNRLVLKESDWCFQRYIWEANLNAMVIPKEKIIKTPIYGIVSSGNQAERGLRMTADLCKESHPEVHQVIHKDLYVDDCVTGAATDNKAVQLSEGLIEVLATGGFDLKSFTFSGRPPDPDLSKDGESIGVLGSKWFSEADELQLNINELNFSRKQFGKKDTSRKSYEIPKKLVRRQCASKVGEVFDLRGLVAPITATFKLDLRKISHLNWDDTIPDELREIWVTNFELMNDLRNVRFKRAIVPEDAVNLDINTIDTGDASPQIAAAAIYARFLRENGEYSCQLVFARTKLLDEGTTQPRGELLAAHLNTHTAEVVRRSFGSNHKSSIKLTDSQIVLHWIHNADLRLKVFCRNRVTDILRFTERNNWKYVKSADMPADIATRHGKSIQDVGPGSTWQEGYPWMKGEVSSFPTKSIEDIKLDAQQKQLAKAETMVIKENNNWLDWPNVKRADFVAYQAGKIVPSDVEKRYEFSKYLLDPNKHRFRTVVRRIAYLKKFVKNFVRKWSKKSTDKPIPPTGDDFDVFLTDDEVAEGEKYYYEKATQEVKKFAKQEKIKDISVEKEGILYFTGRLLNRGDASPIKPLSDVMLDLQDSTFVVPIVEKHSPLAYSIVNEVHWEDPVAKHSGVETVLRYTMKYAYIIEGRELVKKVRRNCERCRFLAKRTIEVIMGPKSAYNLMIAPPFYVTQVDLTGPFKAYTPHNKRATIKIYLVVFCCATTGTININVMENYTAEAFLKAYIRHSCNAGYPKILLTDEGSQLIKGCKEMLMNFRDAQRRLYVRYKCEFKVCPVGGHNMHGRVERKIRHVKESLEKTVHNERLSVIEWETVGAEISNSINDLPITLHNWSQDLENLDLITPNRLRLGRNNDRSPIGPLLVTTKPDQFIESNERIFTCWFEHWLISCVPHLVHQPKWFRTDYDLQKGDVVLFLKEEGSLVGSYQYGMVESVETDKDEKIRTVNVRYQNHNESHQRTTRRAVRELVMIHPADELNIMEELGEISTYADMRCKIAHEDSLNTRGGV